MNLELGGRILTKHKSGRVETTQEAGKSSVINGRGTSGGGRDYKGDTTQQARADGEEVAS